jgi:hypothetical protein
MTAIQVVLAGRRGEVLEQAITEIGMQSPAGATSSGSPGSSFSTTCSRWYGGKYARVRNRCVGSHVRDRTV